MKNVPIKLIQKLNILVTSLEVEQCKDEHGYISYNRNLPKENRWFNDLLDEIDGDLSAFLITSDGKPDFEAIEAMRLAGYTVTKGESDSFGWLTGVLHTKVGKVVYG